LGFFAKEYTPTFRGFDSYFGFWTDTEDYYSHVSYDNGYGLDLRRDLQVNFIFNTEDRMSGFPQGGTLRAERNFSLSCDFLGGTD
jgi:hypothetical protein